MNTTRESLILALALGLSVCLLWTVGCGQSDEQPTTSLDGHEHPPSAEQARSPSLIEPEPPDGRAKPTAIEWVHSESEGLALAKKTGKPSIIDFYADWCPPCQQMDKYTFPDQRVIEELSRFVAIKVDLTRPTAEDEALAGKYNVKFIPTYVLTDTQGRQSIVSGYHRPDEFLKLLKDIK